MKTRLVDTDDEERISWIRTRIRCNYLNCIVLLCKVLLIDTKCTSCCIAVCNNPLYQRCIRTKRYSIFILALIGHRYTLSYVVCECRHSYWCSSVERIVISGVLWWSYYHIVGTVIAKGYSHIECNVVQRDVGLECNYREIHLSSNQRGIVRVDVEFLSSVVKDEVRGV